jgi:type II secretory pathway pseudopilin PulG
MRALASFFGILLVLALIIKLICWILGVIAIVVLFRLLRAQAGAARARKDAALRRAAQLAARADQQHRWVLRGDERGVYGEYPVADLFRAPRWSQTVTAER